MTLMEKVLQAAEPYIKGKGLTVADGVLGINFVGVQLSNGRSHFSYLMREALPSGDMIFPYGEAMIVMDARAVCILRKMPMNCSNPCPLLRVASRSGSIPEVYFAGWNP